MTAPTATPALVRAKLRTVLHHEPTARFVALHAEPTWVSGPLDHDGRAVPVVPCASPLAVRQALQAHAGGTGPVVLLTPVDGHDLGVDVRARLARRQVLGLDRWIALLELFAASRLDPRVQKVDGLVDILLALSPGSGYSPAPGGLVDLTTAWRALADRVGAGEDLSDLTGLLRASLQPAVGADLANLDDGLRGALCAWLSASGGPAVQAVLRCLDEGRFVEAAPAGLALRVLAGGTSVLEHELVRLEAWTGRPAPRGRVALAWAEAAEEVVAQLDDPRAASSVLGRAARILADVGAEAEVGTSPVLPAGFDARRRRVAEQLGLLLDGGGGAVDAAVADALTHRSAIDDPQRARVLRMAGRLARRFELADPEPTNLAEAVATYAADLAYADLALVAVEEGDSLPEVAEAYGRLARAVRARRAPFDQRFARLLADGGGEVGPGVLPVEEVLGRVVGPLATERPVLVVVMDGMSSAVAGELLEGVHRQGWDELALPDTGTARPLALAALPTITEISRTSLLCGALVEGTAATEERGFASSAALPGRTSAATAPRLFHKKELAGPAGQSLHPDVAAAIASARKVIGVVVNQVDDYLLKSDQDPYRWSLDDVPVLRRLLEAARDAERTVVLTADHGHVLQGDAGEYRPAVDAGERWRHGIGDLRLDEVAVSGRRVVKGGGTVYLPATDSLRYSPGKRTGYHGGATPQEAVVPLAVLSYGDTQLPGWTPLPPRTPAWWTGAATVEPPAGGELELGLALPAQPSAPVRPVWIERLFEAPAYQRQVQRAARVAPPPERVAAILVALEARGFTLTLGGLAAATGIAEHRIGQVLSGLSRVLNLDGYPVLLIDGVSASVTLNRQLLVEQFAVKGVR